MYIAFKFIVLRKLQGLLKFNDYFPFSTEPLFINFCRALLKNINPHSGCCSSVLRMWSSVQLHYHHLRTCLKCKLSDSTPDLLNQKQTLG